MLLHEKIRAARVLSRISQKEMAAKIGVSQSYLSEIERGDKKISAVRLLEIVKVVGKAQGVALLTENNCQREAVSFAQWITLQRIRMKGMSFQIPNASGVFADITEEALYLKFKESIT